MAWLGGQELLGHCSALYQENQRRICNLERHLRQYGYNADFPGASQQLRLPHASGIVSAHSMPDLAADQGLVSPKRLHSIYHGKCVRSIGTALMEIMDR